MKFLMKIMVVVKINRTVRAMGVFKEMKIERKVNKCRNIVIFNQFLMKNTSNETNNNVFIYYYYHHHQHHPPLLLLIIIIIIAIMIALLIALLAE